MASPLPTTPLASSSNPLPPPLLPSSPPPQLITQGAEAHLYKTVYLSPALPCALKHRPPKPYRHPTLDTRLTRHRLLSEGRALARCRRAGVRVPAVYALDADAGWIMLEWVEGGSIRQGLDGWMAMSEEAGDGNRDGGEGHRGGVRRMMAAVGELVGRMHAAGVVHGDLTTSNLMLRPRGQKPEGSQEAGDAGAQTGTGVDGEVVLIDFGLATQSVQDEDRAVDLYVLERAFGSTHSRAERLFEEVLAAYGQSFKGARVVLRRLEDVRMRGRKRSMLG